MVLSKSHKPAELNRGVRTNCTGALATQRRLTLPGAIGGVTKDTGAQGAGEGQEFQSTCIPAHAKAEWRPDQRGLSRSA
jgi:hypothetical protein